MWFILLFFLLIPPVFATESSVSVTASVGGQNRVTINGYTSPKSRVELSSPKVFSVTYSDDSGYFIFDKAVLPNNPSDLCLSSIDQNFRYTTPVCIPAPPPQNSSTDIGPILLPPTISLENDKINPHSTVITSGQAIPNSAVNLNFYKVNDSALSFPKKVQAYSLPTITAVSDSQGNYSLSLPTAYSSSYRLYASSKFKDNYSPKSNTLLYILPSLFYIFLQQNRFLIFLFPLYIFTLIIFFYLLHLYYQKIPSQKRFLPALRNFYPAIFKNPTLQNLKNNSF